MNNQFTTTIEAANAQAKHNLDRTVSGLKSSTVQVTAGIEQVQDKMRGGVEHAMKTAEEMFSFYQGNIEAVAHSSQIFASGLQDLSQRIAATARTTMEETVSTIKALSSVKSLKEATDLQQNLARATLEKAVAQTGQIADRSIKLTEQTFAPITARMTLAVEKFSKTA